LDPPWNRHTGSYDYDREKYPHAVNWHHPTGDRLTRTVSTTRYFTNRDEALAAVAAPFPANTSHASYVDRERGGLVGRKRGGKMTFKKFPT
jgi:hypothetical protein